MAFLSRFFRTRWAGWLAGRRTPGVDALEDATFEATVKADRCRYEDRAEQSGARLRHGDEQLQPPATRSTRSTCARAQEWKDRAGMALDAGNEDLAKKALAKKAECDQQVNSMKLSVEQAQADQREAEAAGGRAEAQDRRRRAHRRPRWWRARTPLWRSARSAKPWRAWAARTTRSPRSTASSRPSRSEEATAKAFDQLASAGKDDDLGEAVRAALGPAMWTPNWRR